MTTDPIADLLIRLKNAAAVKHEHVHLPYSKMKHALADVLSREGYVGEVKKHASGALEITLRYNNGKSAIAGTKRVSKPSRRLYAGVSDIRLVKNGHGLLVLSTPQGIMTGKEARQKRVGGETLFEIW